MIYFAVGSDAGKSWPNLSWVARNFAEQKICFLHILQPTKMIPSSLCDFSYIVSNSNTLSFSLILIQALTELDTEYEPRVSEKQRVQQVLKEYHRILNDSELEGGGDVYLKMQKIEMGIVMLISRLNIKNLVMGAAVSKEMVYITSEITEYVSENARATCQIWFVHDGNLIKTRYDQIITEGSSKIETCSELVWREKTEKESRDAVFKGKNKTSESKDVLTLDWSDTFCSSSSKPSAPPVVDLSHSDEESEDENLLQTAAQSKENKSNLLSLSALNEEGAVFDELYKRLEKAMEEVENSKREAFEESSRCRAVERDAVGASRRAKAVEIDMKSQLVEALREKSLLENEIAEYKTDNNELTEKITLSVEMMRRYKNERDELKATLEMNHSTESSMSSNDTLPQFLSEYSYSEIQEATRYFDPSLKLDDRRYWVMYKGVLHHTEVDIKLFDADSSKGRSEYLQEVEALSRLRHPNIVTLIGACHEALAIIYEHSPNGSLEDRLICRNNSSPLQWQTRISIASELCAVLVFLQNKSHCTVHGDLELGNILLDANFNVKLSHFGLSLTMSAKYASKDYTPELDVYAFGIILLRLLTGREAWGLTEEVQIALDNGNLETLLDSLAGDWPFIQAQQLAKIALRCSDVSYKNRPDLESEIISVLRKMKASCQGSPMESSSSPQAPHYYICPISQDVMEDPYVAADGFTYEKEGIQGWLKSGHNTSPMTNLKLEHTMLVPNRTLRSAIHEWRLHL